MICDVDLTDRTAVVTGAAGVIGSSVARLLVDRGSRVCLVDRRADEVESVAEGLGDAAMWAVADVTDAEQVETCVRTARSRLGRLDMFHNNAGVYGPFATLCELAIEDFDRDIAVNLRGVFLGLRAALPLMADGGAIVNTSSTAAFRGSRMGAGAYAASKAAVISLTKTAAIEAGPAGVRVNAVCPGVLRSTMTAAAMAAIRPGDPHAAEEELTRGLPLGRVAEPAEVAQAVVWLLSPASRYVSGAAYVVDGGMLA